MQVKIFQGHLIEQRDQFIPKWEAWIQGDAAFAPNPRSNNQDGKYEKAHTAFNQMLASSPADLADRIRIYISACLQQISKGKTDFASDEERYDYAVSLLNDGHYEDARNQLKQITAKNSEADYAFYGLAVLASMTGDAQSCPDKHPKARH